MAITQSAKDLHIKREWLLIDANEQILGRLASFIASRLRGKHRPYYTPHVDTGDYIIVLNASNIKVTGKKLTQKHYWRHTGYPGGIKSQTLSQMQDKNPSQAIELAVKRMLPRGPLGRQMLKKLRIYPGNEHPHQAQRPIAIEELNTLI